MNFEKNIESYNTKNNETVEIDELAKKEEKFLGMFDKPKMRKVAYIMSLMTMFSMGSGYKAGQVDAEEIKTGDKKEQKLNQEQLDNLRSYETESERSNQVDWKDIAFSLSEEQEDSKKELGKILKDVWGEDFSASILLVDSEKIQGSYDFTVGGLYSSSSDEIKLNADFLSQINDKENALKFWDLAFHESGHADNWFDKYEFLEQISEELNLEGGEVYGIIKSSEILDKEKRRAFENRVYVNDILDETYASFAEVYGGVKMREKNDFPTEEYLANASLNKIYRTEKEKNFYGHKSLNSSTYLAVEFFSILLINEYNNDLEELRKFLQESTREERSREIIRVFEGFQKEKAEKMNLDLDNQSPADLYQSLLEKGENDYVIKEEQAVSDFFSSWIESFCRQNNLESNMMQEKINSLKTDNVFGWLATCAYDEINSLETYNENQKKDIDISKQELELLDVVKNFYQYLFQLKKKPNIQELREKIDKVKAELDTYEEEEDFSLLHSRIEKEKDNLEKIYNDLNVGGFERRN